MEQPSIIILSAGKGTRMKSNTPKVLHKIAGREMLNMAIDVAKKTNPKNITIVISQELQEYQDKIISQHPDFSIDFAIQAEQKGTGHAVSSAINLSKNTDKYHGKVLILYGDTPLISLDTLNKMLLKLDSFKICVLGFENYQNNSYGRLVTDSQNNLLKIIEVKDADEQQKKITLCNSGVIAIDGKILPDLLADLKNNNATQEFYLTDIIEIANQNGHKATYISTFIEEVLGVNSRVELANLEKIFQKQIRQKMMENGVTLVAPKTVYFSYDTIIANDTIIHPHVVFGEKVIIDSLVEIKSFSHLEGVHVKQHAKIGPFARIRPQTTIEEGVNIGNFVEIKKSTIGNNSKINHLSYIGDTKIGKSSNIGAGTITCNYDGFKKYTTQIGNNVFIGSNSALIAPLIIQDGAMIGAGSIITKNVDANDLAIARNLQKNLPNGANKFRNSKKTKNDI
jgi:bifunctional UDP-N-acetylglucosamine pyrophosphorylase/glucosamine-1-phosphate N-acetyltransferase